MGGLYGEAQKLFIPTAPGSKGAPSSQALAFCYANSLSRISCLLHGQTSTFLRTSRDSSSHFILTPPINTKHTDRQSLLYLSLYHSTLWHFKQLKMNWKCGVFSISAFILYLTFFLNTEFLFKLRPAFNKTIIFLLFCHRELIINTP